MRGRMLLAKWGLVLGSGVAAAQFQPQFPSTPASPQAPQFPVTNPPAAMPGFPQSPASPRLPDPFPPNPLPPLQPAQPVRPGLPYTFPQPGTPGGMSVGLPPLGSPNQRPGPQPPSNPIAQPQEIPLPQPENKIAIKTGDVSLKRVQGGWQLWAGQKVLRDFGDRETDARDAFNVYRDLRPTEWVTIGTGKSVVEYALVNGRPPMAAGTPVPQDNNSATGAGGFSSSGPVATGAGAKFVYPIDMKTVRVEAIRGVWCLRDDYNLHLNFGPAKTDADQALAVVQRYGFNRIGVVGSEPTPVMKYFFAGSGDAQFDRGPLAKAVLQGQIDGLTRTGIAVPGVGYVGESVRFDPERLDVRKENSEWVVAGGTEVLGRYGVGEWNAREAARNIRDMHANEYCKVGSAGLTFFLTDGKAPARLPFAVQGRRFDPSGLKVVQYSSRCAVTENGRHLFDCATAAEGETLIRVVKHFGFDQICQLGPTGKSGVSFLAKGQ